MDYETETSFPDEKTGGSRSEKTQTPLPHNRTRGFRSEKTQTSLLDKIFFLMSNVM